MFNKFSVHPHLKINDSVCLESLCSGNFYSSLLVLFSLSLVFSTLALFFFKFFFKKKIFSFYYIFFKLCHHFKFWLLISISYNNSTSEALAVPKSNINLWTNLHSLRRRSKKWGKKRWKAAERGHKKMLHM